MIHVNSELLIREPIEPNYDVPEPVQQHVDALGSYASNLLGANELSPEAETFAHLFARRHDSGYGVDISLMQTDYARHVLGEALAAVGSQVDPRLVADYLQYNANDYMAARIIGHGVLSLVENTRYFQQERQMSYQKALGLASILSAHHCGFPITMVSGYLQGDAMIPAEARSAFFIDEGGENPELIRRRLAELGASKLGISPSDALRAAVLGYSLDRLSAGSIPDELAWSVSKGVELRGGEVVQKKYGLVAGDLNRREQTDSLIVELYHTVLLRIEAEAKAAVAAAEAADAPDIRQFVETQHALIYAATHEAQQGALTVMYLCNFLGRFSQLHEERELLSIRIECMENPSPAALYALATYDQIINSINKGNT